jgi:peptide deformylase
MSAKDVLTLGESLLREKCEWVENPQSEDIKALVTDLRDTLEETFRRTGYGRGIAAPQIGELKRVVYLSSRVLGKELVLVNPKIVSCSDEMVTVWDSCLCFLSIFMPVERHKRITVEYYDIDGHMQRLEAGAENDLSELLQHELDHLDGILCLDRVKNVADIVSLKVFEKHYRSESPYALNAR